MSSIRTGKLGIFVAVFILLAGITVSGFIFLKAKTGSANISQQISYLMGQDASQQEKNRNIDSDNDALPDWREKIYGTDPKKSDTDNDGYLDGEEVASGYDPLKKAPDDALSTASQPRPLPENLTKALASKLGQGLVGGKIKSFNKETGQPLTAEEFKNDLGLNLTLEEVLRQPATDFVVPEITDKEIKISATNDKAEAISYLSKVSNILSSLTSSLAPKSDMQIASEAIESNNFDELKENQKVYQAGYQKMKEVSVPPDLISFHKGLLGVFWAMNNIYLAVENIQSDPLKATIAIGQYQNVSQQFGDLLKQLISQIKNIK